MITPFTSVQCPMCSAEVGERCVSASGKKVIGYHAKRVARAKSNLRKLETQNMTDKLLLTNENAEAIKPGNDVRALPPNTLEVGHRADTHEVVINHPDLKPDEHGVGHIIFSPQQARDLARLLLRHAKMAYLEAGGMHPDVAEIWVDREGF